MSDGKRLGLIIDGIDLFDKWQITVKDRNIGKPNKKKALESVAHSSKVYDFSPLYGEDNFEERPLSYVLNIIGTKKDRMTAQFLEIEFNNFIMSKSQFKLVDEVFPGYYFLAEVRQGTDFSALFNFGELTVNMDAYAYRIKEAKEGSPYWDDYSILDYYQEVKFTVSGTKTIELVNTGSKTVVPIIKASAPMNLKLSSSSVSIAAGITRSEDIVLVKGKNTILVTGNGEIEFEFHKELI